jgi:octaprenyl-diphosphate synthase
MPSNVVPLKKLETSNPYEELRSTYQSEIEKVDDFIKDKLSSHVELIGEMASYLFKSGGKRLRPLLTIASSSLFGYQGDRHIKLAACVELIHNATLLHDDVIDKSDFRRGNKTNNNIWGNKNSILTGDYLLSRCFEIMVEDGSLEVLKLLSSVSSEIAQGEILQLQHEKEIETLEKTYLEIIGAKTSSLFAAAMRVGGCINDRSKNEKEALTSFGANFGISFQITDDILDYYSNSTSFGKSIGNDFHEGKITLPMIMLYQKSNDSERLILKNMFIEKERTIEQLNYTLNLMSKYKVIAACKKRAEHFSSVSSDSLGIFPETKEKKRLQDLAFYIVNRIN